MKRGPKAGSGVKLNLCRTYLDKKKYRKLPTHQLARIIYDEHIELFASFDSVRTTLRKLRGSQGKVLDVHKADVAKYKKDNPRDNAPYGSMPKSKKHFKDWQHYKVDKGIQNALILSDVHMPYHDPEALELACEIGVEQGVEAVILNGDFIDCFAVSFWQKDPRQVDFQAEIDTVIEGFEYLRYMFPDIPIIFKMGNHEDRYIRYMTQKAVELLGVTAFEFENLFCLDEYGIEMVDGKRPIVFQDYTILHGHEFYGSGGAFPAKGYFMKTKVNTISAHLHRSSYYSEKDVNGVTKRSYSSGCLCDLTPDYSPLNAWNHGFLIIKRGKSGARVENYDIEDGQLV